MTDTESRAYAINVKALIRERYSIDDEIALLANHIDTPEETWEEWDAYQSYRKECKQKAREQMG